MVENEEGIEEIWMKGKFELRITFQNIAANEELRKSWKEVGNRSIIEKYGKIKTHNIVGFIETNAKREDFRKLERVFGLAVVGEKRNRLGHGTAFLGDKFSGGKNDKSDGNIITPFRNNGKMVVLEVFNYAEFDNEKRRVETARI